jgi:hypothetical protein
MNLKKLKLQYKIHIETLNKTQGFHTWKTLKNAIETALQNVKNGERIFSRDSEVETVLV